MSENEEKNCVPIAALEILNVDEAAQYLRCSKSNLYHRVKAGTIPHVKMGGRILFKKDDLYSWLGSAGAQEAI